MYNILDFTHVIIATINSPSLYTAWEYASNAMSHYYNYYVVEVR